MILLLLHIILVLQHVVNMEAFEKSETIYFRVNQLGYLPDENKIAIAFSHDAIREKIFLISVESKSSMATLKPERSKSKGWGTFNYYYEIDFSQVESPGHYFLQGQKTNNKSQTFSISPDAYKNHTETLLDFMRQQRCGYNPFLDMVCHKRDGRIFYDTLPDSSYVDVSGGWHDAGDQLKYLITGSYATAHMLKAFELYPGRFSNIIYPT